MPQGTFDTASEVLRNDFLNLLSKSKHSTGQNKILSIFIIKMLSKHAFWIKSNSILFQKLLYNENLISLCPFHVKSLGKPFTFLIMGFSMYFIAPSWNYIKFRDKVLENGGCVDFVCFLCCCHTAMLSVLLSHC